MGTTNGGPPWRGHVRVRAWKVWRGGCRLSCGPRVQKSPEGTWGGMKENKYSRGRSEAWLDRVWTMDKD